MKICFYADLYWILNFIMNIFILSMTAYLSQSSYKMLRWCITSAICSAVSLLITYFCHTVFDLKAVAASFAEILIMLYIALRPHSFKMYVRQICYFFEVTFITAGFLMTMRNILLETIIKHSRMSLIMIFAGITILAIVFLCLRQIMLKEQINRKSVDKALLINRGKKYEIKVLYDTGNHLISPYTGEPVMIISKEFAVKAGLYDMNPVLIPYHSIGGDGLLNAYRLDFLKIERGEIKKNFLAAVSDELCTDKEIQMILNIT